MLTTLLTTLLLGAPAAHPPQELVATDGGNPAQKSKGLVLVVALGDKDKKDDKQPDQKEGELKIFAQGPWPSMMKPGTFGQFQMVLRSPEEVAKAMVPKDMKLPEGGAEMMAKQVNTALKVKEIDWKKQMVILVGPPPKELGKGKAEVTALKVKDKTLTVHWKMVPGKTGGAGIPSLATAALVERFEGKVTFDPPAAKETEPEKDKVKDKGPPKKDPSTGTEKGKVEEKDKGKDSGKPELKPVKPSIGGGDKDKGNENKDKKQALLRRLNQPTPEAILTQVVACPAHAVQGERFEGSGRFDVPRLST
jgi:hypothetical protein